MNISTHAFILIWGNIYAYVRMCVRNMCISPQEYKLNNVCECVNPEETQYCRAELSNSVFVIHCTQSSAAFFFL